MTATADSQARAVALTSYLHALRGQLGDGCAPPEVADPLKAARELYVAGTIDLSTFELRVDVALQAAAA